MAVLVLSPSTTKLISIDTTSLEIVSVEDMGAWLNLPPGILALNTALIEQLIDFAVDMIEKYTWLDLRRKTYEARYDLTWSEISSYGWSCSMRLERSPILAVSDIADIEYLGDDNQYAIFDRGVEAADGLYENITQTIQQRDWALLHFVVPPAFQSLVTAYLLKVGFTAGFDQTDPVNSVPPSLLVAIKMIVANRYVNRGDCLDCGCKVNGMLVPCEVKGILDQYRLSIGSLGIY